MRARCLGPWLMLVALAGALLSSPARAQNPADITAARDLFREGAKLAQENKWDEARDRYTRSLALKRAPLTLYSLGVADQNLGHYVEALESFHAFLAEMDPKNDAYKPFEQPARDAIAALEPKVGKLDVRVEPKDAPDLHVLVDKVEVPKAALFVPRAVDPGEHTIVVRAHGFPEVTETRLVREGELVDVLITLKPPVDKPPPPPKEKPLKPTPPPTPVVPYALFAGGGAMFLTGAVLGLVGVQKASDAPSADGREADKARKFGIVGDVVGGLGLVTAGAGLALLLTDKATPQQGAASPAVSVRPFATPGFLGVVGRF